MMATKMCEQSGNIFCFSDLSLLNTCSFLWLNDSGLHEEVNIHMSLSYIMNKICVQLVILSLKTMQIKQFMFVA